MPTTEVTCPLCGASLAAPLFTKRRTDYWACAGCTFRIATPDVDSLTAKLFGRRWHFYSPYHLSYLGPRTIARAAAPHGLRMLDVRHRGRLRSAAYMVRYAAEMIGGLQAPRWARWLDGW